MYSKCEKIVVFLSSFEFMTFERLKKIIEVGIEDFFEDPKKFKNELEKNFSSLQLDLIESNKNIKKLDEFLKSYDEMGIKVVTILSSQYPEKLKNIKNPPIILYCKGDISLLNKDCLAVVGSRRATKYGKEMCAKFVSDIASSGIMVISGLAEGIDTIAHRNCLDSNEKTIAVLGSGINNIYPSVNKSLAQEIVNSGGLILSEYKPSEPGVSRHFPVRNRIIAGLSKVVFIVESANKSGTQYTKNYALDFGREIFALPGRVGDIFSEGCNQAILKGEAKILLSPSQIINSFGKESFSFKKENSQLSFEENLIYKSLYGHEKHFDEIIKETKLDTKTLLTVLMRMELGGIVSKLPGNYFKVNN